MKRGKNYRNARTQKHVTGLEIANNLTTGLQVVNFSDRTPFVENSYRTPHIMIRLEKFSKPDYDRLISWINSEASMIQFSGPIFNYPITYEQLDIYVNTVNRLAFCVVNADTNEVIGHAD